MVLLADQVMEMVLQAVVLVVIRVEMVRLGRLVPMGLVVTRVEDRPGRLAQRRPLKPECQCLARPCLRNLGGTPTTVRIPQEGFPTRDPEVRNMRMMMTIIARR